MMKTTMMAGAGAIVGAGVLTLAMTAGWAQPTQQFDQQPDSQPERRPDGRGGPDMGRMLIEGLKASDGCLGVDAAQTMSGRNTIIAWFENKAAAKRWYYSDTHQGVMGRFADPDGDEGGEPLAHVENEDTPIMVMATITMAERPAFEGLRMPISQISIELYAPLPGGAFLGERLAPEGFRVPHMRDYTPER